MEKKCIKPKIYCNYRIENGNCSYSTKVSKPCQDLSYPKQRMDPYNRAKARVYATGNKWAIENFHATHD